MRDALENGLEKFIFASRWILAPIYVGLIGALLIIVFSFFREFVDLVNHIFFAEQSATHEEITLGVLALLDIGLLANLLLIVIFAGYENFVSKINAAEGSEDRPHWMGHIDFSGLKIKLIGSLVAISVIELLQDFVAANDTEHPLDYTAVKWRIGLHLTFLLSGVMFAVMDYIGDKRKIMLDKHTRGSADPLD